MGASLWTLVDRYDESLSLMRSRVAGLREEILARASANLPREDLVGLYSNWLAVLRDTERLRDLAAAGCEKCEGPRAAG